MFLLKNIDISLGQSALFSILAMLIVFAVLIILVVIISLFSKIKFKEEKEEAAPVAASAPQNKFTIDDIKDEDMMVAALVATADFIEETKKTDARVVSIKQIG